MYIKNTKTIAKEILGKFKHRWFNDELVESVNEDNDSVPIDDPNLQRFIDKFTEDAENEVDLFILNKIIKNVGITKIHNKNESFDVILYVFYSEKDEDKQYSCETKEAFIDSFTEKDFDESLIKKYTDIVSSVQRVGEYFSTYGHTLAWGGLTYSQCSYLYGEKHYVCKFDILSEKDDEDRLVVPIFLHLKRNSKYKDIDKSIMKDIEDEITCLISHEIRHAIYYKTIKAPTYAASARAYFKLPTEINSYTDAIYKYTQKLNKEEVKYKLSDLFVVFFLREVLESESFYNKRLEKELLEWLIRMNYYYDRNHGKKAPKKDIIEALEIIYKLQINFGKFHYKKETNKEAEEKDFLYFTENFLFPDENLEDEEEEMVCELDFVV